MIIDDNFQGDNRFEKQQALDLDPEVIHQLHFTRNQDRGDNAAIFLIIKETKDTILNFSRETVRVCKFVFALI